MNKPNNRLELTDTLMSCMMKVAEGNPEAVNVLMEAFKNTSKIDPDSAFEGMTLFFDFDSLGIYGSKIWMLYKDVCGQDHVNLHAVMRAFQLGILPESSLRRAINGEETLDLPDLLAKVRERLPRFASEKVEAPR